jgi:hypothetical protein
MKTAMPSRAAASNHLLITIVSVSPLPLLVRCPWLARDVPLSRAVARRRGAGRHLYGPGAQNSRALTPPAPSRRRATRRAARECWGTTAQMAPTTRNHTSRFPAEAIEAKNILEIHNKKRSKHPAGICGFPPICSAAVPTRPGWMAENREKNAWQCGVTVIPTRPNRLPLGGHMLVGAHRPRTITIGAARRTKERI